MPDEVELEDSADLSGEQEADDEDADDEVTDTAEDTSDGDSEDESDDTEGGSGGDTSTQVVVPPVVERPTGKGLLDLLVSDEEAQRLLAGSLESLSATRAAAAAAESERAEFTRLEEEGNFEELGKRISENARNARAREQVTDLVLKEQFTPVYAEIFAQPEMKTLSAEEREALNPQKYASDAHYVRALETFVQHKRHESAIEAEVEKRFQARIEAQKNGTIADKSKTKSVAAATVNSTGQVSPRRDTDSLLLAGFRGAVGDNDDDDE